MLALAASLAAGGALAATSLDDLFLEKIRFIQYHAPQLADYATATPHLTLSVNQADGQQLAALGRAYMRLQDYENALGVLAAAVRVAPSNADAQADLALVSAVQGRDWATSRAAYDRAVTLKPELAELRHVQHARALCPGG